MITTLSRIPETKPTATSFVCRTADAGSWLGDSGSDGFGIFERGSVTNRYPSPTLGDGSSVRAA